MRLGVFITVTLRCRFGKTFLVLLATVIYLCALSTASPAQEGDIDLRFRDDTFTAYIKDAPLQGVMDRIREKTGIWFHTSSRGSFEDEKITVTFRNLSIKDGLDRILSSMNYSLFFDKSGVVGVMLLGKPDKTSRSRKAPTRRRTLRRSPRRR